MYGVTRKLDDLNLLVEDARVDRLKEILVTVKELI